MRKRDEHVQDEREAEADLVRRCIAGDSDAHTEFYRRFRRQTAANLYRVLGRADEVDDLLQDVFVIAFRSLPKFRAEARLSTWLYRISVNVALGRIRQKSRRPSHVLAEPEVLEAAREAEGESPPTPAAQLIQKDDQRRVYRVLEQLSTKKRIVLFLHEIEGRELKEIAYLLETNPVTIRTRLYYARKEFYRLLAKDQEDEERDEAVSRQAQSRSREER